MEGLTSKCSPNVFVFTMFYTVRTNNFSISQQFTYHDERSFQVQKNRTTLTQEQADKSILEYALSF